MYKTSRESIGEIITVLLVGIVIGLVTIAIMTMFFGEYLKDSENWRCTDHSYAQNMPDRKIICNQWTRGLGA